MLQARSLNNASVMDNHSVDKFQNASIPQNTTSIPLELESFRQALTPAAQPQTSRRPTKKTSITLPSRATTPRSSANTASVAPRTSATGVIIQPRRSISSQDAPNLGVRDIADFNGFAFNGPDQAVTTNKGQKKMHELVTMRVKTFSERRLESYRRTSLTQMIRKFKAEDED